MDINKSCPLLSSLEILACVHTLFLGDGFTISIFSLSSNCHGKYRLSFFVVLRSLLKTSGLFTGQLSSFVAKTCLLTKM